MNIRNFTNEITVGSAAFFAGLEGFEPKTTDKLEIIPAVRNGWWRYCGTADGISHYKWQQHTLQELVDKLKKCTDCKRISTLLVPDFAKVVAPKVNAADYLEAIAPAIGRLCDKHQWGKAVYEAYKENGNLEMSEEQRKRTFAVYRATRADSRQSVSRAG